MASRHRLLMQSALALAAAAMAGALFYIGTGMWPLWWAPWCAALVVLAVAVRVPGWLAFSSGALAWLAGALNMRRYAWNILAVPSDGHTLTVFDRALGIAEFIVVPALAFGLAVALFRACVRRGQLWQASLAFPAAWAAYEYLSSLVSPHGTFGSLAYSQMDVLPLIQIASVTGIWGISFCMLLVPATVAALTATGHSARQRVAATAITVSIAVCVAGFGIWRLQTPASPTVTVGLVASDLPANVDVQEPGAPLQRLLRNYADAARSLVAQGAHIVVLPEKLGVTVPATISADDAVLQALADEANVVVVYSAIRREGDRRYNAARVYAPHQPVHDYDKHHLVPAFESRYTRGTTRMLVSRAPSPMGIAICKDMDFPTLARAYGADGVGLMLVPAWDFGDDDWLHARMAILRGVESGFAIARAAKEGLLSVSDNRGRVLAYRSSKAAPFATLLADAPTTHEETIYRHFGDWFAVLCLALAAIPAANITRPKGWARRET